MKREAVFNIHLRQCVYNELGEIARRSQVKDET